MLAVLPVITAPRPLLSCLGDLENCEIRPFKSDGLEMLVINVDNPFPSSIPNKERKLIAIALEYSIAPQTLSHNELTADLSRETCALP
jgi:hypothetical protein